MAILRLLIVVLATFSVVHAQGMYGYEILRHKDFTNTYANVISGYNTVMYNPKFAYSTIDEVSVNGFKFSPFMFRSTANYLPVSYVNIDSISVVDGKISVVTKPDKLFRLTAGFENETGEPFATLFSGATAYNKFPRSLGTITASYKGFFLAIEHNTDDLFASSFGGLNDYSFEEQARRSNNSFFEGENIFAGYSNDFLNVFGAQKTNKSWIEYNDGEFIRRVQQDHFVGVEGNFKGFFAKGILNSSQLIAEEKKNPISYSLGHIDHNLSLGYKLKEKFDVFVGGGYAKAYPRNELELNPKASLLSVHVPEVVKPYWNIIMDPSCSVDSQLESVKREYLLYGGQCFMDFCQISLNGDFYDSKFRNLDAKINYLLPSKLFFNIELAYDRSFNTLSEDFMSYNSLIPSQNDEMTKILKNHGVALSVDNFVQPHKTVGVCSDLTLSYGKNRFYKTSFYKDSTIYNKFYVTDRHSKLNEAEYLSTALNSSVYKTFSNRDSVAFGFALWKDFFNEEQNNYPLFKAMLAGQHNFTKNFNIYSCIYYETKYGFNELDSKEKVGGNVNMDIVVNQYLFKRKVHLKYEFYNLLTSSQKEYPLGADVLRRFNFMLDISF